MTTVLRNTVHWLPNFQSNRVNREEKYFMMLFELATVLHVHDTAFCTTGSGTTQLHTQQTPDIYTTITANRLQTIRARCLLTSRALTTHKWPLQTINLMPFFFFQNSILTTQTWTKVTKEIFIDNHVDITNQIKIETWLLRWLFQHRTVNWGKGIGLKET